MWSLAFGLLTLFSILVAIQLLQQVWLFVPLVLLGIVIIDTFQNSHSLRKNYPLVGRLRYFFESIRPEIRQYFMEGELDGKPFNRRQKSIVYQRAKELEANHLVWYAG